ncbi:sugar phosphate isomerase/epimerase family protein [Paenibacillus sp. GCM10023248]|uniref:sugar phosphate isomerase/epimerase family protein n=1 Tax=unclassified Paenibacillus TaxID=185978 RepID=UPI0023788751|nr:sugar phosphate isomerase/epimerase [Paenibacillus sp. MAHUQ-63]MDD9268311.1 sugar phosphate isomerase/epimerase [Paenibacillus sp. MAHUQ-63]
MLQNPNPISFSLFVKHWNDKSVPELGAFVKAVGFDGIELPIRAGFHVEPGTAHRTLPALAAQLAQQDIRIFSVAASPEEPVFAACEEAGVPLIRIMVSIESDGYKATEERTKRKLEELAPLCEKYGVKIGVQPHYGNYINDSNGVMRLLENIRPESAGVVWDAAHDAFAGQQPEYGLDIVWTHLAMVNLKNGFFVRSNGPEAESAEWKRHFTTGRHGMAQWPRIVRVLKERMYSGVICLTAEYTDLAHKDRYIAEDLAYAKSLWNE